MQVSAANFRAAMEGLDRVRQAQGQPARQAQPAASGGRDLLAELIRAKQSGGVKAPVSSRRTPTPAPAVAATVARTAGSAFSSSLSAPQATPAAYGPRAATPAPAAQGRTLGNHVDVMA